MAKIWVSGQYVASVSRGSEVGIHHGLVRGCTYNSHHCARTELHRRVMLEQDRAGRTGIVSGKTRDDDT